MKTTLLTIPLKLRFFLYCLDGYLIGFESPNLFKPSQITILTKIGLAADMVKKCLRIEPAGGSLRPEQVLRIPAHSCLSPVRMG